MMMMMSFGIISHILLASGTSSSAPSSIFSRGTTTSCADADARIQAAARMMDGHILPATEKGRRIQLGNHQLRGDGEAVHGQDPILFETYGEFPLPSLDVLLDRAEELLQLREQEQELRNGALSSLPDALQKDHGSRRRTIVDVGSGCGRLALYMALSRPNWDVYGVEISPVFHQEAVEAVHRAVKQGCLQIISEEEDDDNSNDTDGSVSTNTATTHSRLVLHCGPAQEYTSILQKADIIFCYSTAFESAGFSEESAALLLGNDWNVLFADTSTDCLCITTDKALSPNHGWRILDRIDVPNPEVLESTGYIQQRLSCT